ncbi:hypothetical protein FA95DRAFT_1586830 [Auriscalpium vulgare]|uniref:Uncharacterized protein n=1 Tax=Auriscalpium vulgare TaxID=40419 RepID=A0ACB8S879_9AGAM|nr:hypothetical protein FA95DRAFT_1586830 [Auriscalpium vulgare]
MSTLTMNLLAKLNPYAAAPSKLNPVKRFTHNDDSSSHSAAPTPDTQEDDTTVDLTPSDSIQAPKQFGFFAVPSPGANTPTSKSVTDVSVGESKEGIAEIIAEYGSSSATSWLEFDRYKIWRPSADQLIPGSSFPPVQGYLRADPYVFAWGNPLVSDPAALPDTCGAFIDWCKSQKLKCVWLCVDGQMEKVLGGEGSRFNWSTLSCIVEDVLEPKSVIALANGHGGGSEVKDLKKNLRRAEREHVTVREIHQDEWTDEMKHEVEDGIVNWKKNRSGIQIASSSFQPWLDFEHRRYFVAEKDKHIIGVLILSPVHPTQYQIKNAVMFPNAPRGTSEELIYRVMQALQDEDESESHRGVTVTFGVSASDSLTPVDNLSGWKITWLSKTYNGVIGATGLTKRGDFRAKFHSEHQPLYVCYPVEDGFGLDGVNKLIKCLRQ